MDRPARYHIMFWHVEVHGEIHPLHQEHVDVMPENKWKNKLNCQLKKIHMDTA